MVGRIAAGYAARDHRYVRAPLTRRVPEKLRSFSSFFRMVYLSASTRYYRRRRHVLVVDEAPLRDQHDMDPRSDLIQKGPVEADLERGNQVAAIDLDEEEASMVKHEIECESTFASDVHGFDGNLEISEKKTEDEEDAVVGEVVDDGCMDQEEVEDPKEHGLQPVATGLFLVDEEEVTPADNDFDEIELLQLVLFQSLAPLGTHEDPAAQAQRMSDCRSAFASDDSEDTIEKDSRPRNSVNEGHDTSIQNELPLGITESRKSFVTDQARRNNARRWFIDIETSLPGKVNEVTVVSSDEE